MIISWPAINGFCKVWRYRVPGLDIPILMDGMENYWFEVEALSDQENPKIASIELEKNGEILRPGEPGQSSGSKQKIMRL